MRLPKLDPAHLTPEQRALWEKIASGPRGGVRGPYFALLHAPALCAEFESVVRFLRFECSVPERLRELAILVVARRWKSQYEFFAHALIAKRIGIPPEVIDAIRTDRPPAFVREDERTLYTFVHELVTTGFAGEASYQAARRLLGETALVELVTLVGQYGAVALLLNAFEIDVPEGAERPFHD